MGLGNFMESEVGSVVRSIAFLPSTVEFNPAPQLSPVVMVISATSGSRTVEFSYPTSWVLASWRGQYGNQSVDGAGLRPNLTKKSQKVVPNSDVNWENGIKVYSIYDPIGASQLFDRFVADPGCIWPELERILGTMS
jgi:hypothetical protein